MKTMPFKPHQPAANVHQSLRRSLQLLDAAQQCAVLWFADIMKRQLYRELGHPTINRYAMAELGFSKSKTRDFIHLAGKLEKLPAVREAMTSGEVGYTKVREIVAVATPETQDAWLEAAKGSRRELAHEVKRARQAAMVDPNQGELMPASAPVVAPKQLPVRIQLELTPEQEARRAALVERLNKLGAVSSDRAELMLEGLAALVEAREKGPRGPLATRPPVQIHVHETNGRMTVQTASGERELSRSETERMRCDAAVCVKGGRNTATIPPRVRREVLARDRHRCRAPGCDRALFLEVHHVQPRNRGGTNAPDNLITLCSTCHRFWHEKGVGETGIAPLSP